MRSLCGAFIPEHSHIKQLQRCGLAVYESANDQSGTSSCFIRWIVRSALRRKSLGCTLRSSPDVLSQKSMICLKLLKSCRRLSGCVEMSPLAPGIPYTSMQSNYATMQGAKETRLSSIRNKGPFFDSPKSLVSGLTDSP